MFKLSDAYPAAQQATAHQIYTCTGTQLDEQKRSTEWSPVNSLVEPARIRKALDTYGSTLAKSDYSTRNVAHISTQL